MVVLVITSDRSDKIPAVLEEFGESLGERRRSVGSFRSWGGKQAAVSQNTSPGPPTSSHLDHLACVMVVVMVIRVVVEVMVLVMGDGSGDGVVVVVVVVVKDDGGSSIVCSGGGDG